MKLKQILAGSALAVMACAAHAQVPKEPAVTALLNDCRDYKLYNVTLRDYPEYERKLCIKLLQTLLFDSGYFSGKPDGVLGAATLQGYQRLVNATRDMALPNHPLLLTREDISNIHVLLEHQQGVRGTRLITPPASGISTATPSAGAAPAGAASVGTVGPEGLAPVAVAAPLPVAASTAQGPAVDPPLPTPVEPSPPVQRVPPSSEEMRQKGAASDPVSPTTLEPVSPVKTPGPQQTGVETPPSVGNTPDARAVGPNPLSTQREQNGPPGTSPGVSPQSPAEDTATNSTSLFDSYVWVRAHLKTWSGELRAPDFLGIADILIGTLRSNWYWFALLAALLGSTSILFMLIRADRSRGFQASSLGHPRDRGGIKPGDKMSPNDQRERRPLLGGYLHPAQQQTAVHVDWPTEINRFIERVRRLGDQTPGFGEHPCAVATILHDLDIKSGRPPETVSEFDHIQRELNKIILLIRNLAKDLADIRGADTRIIEGVNLPGLYAKIESVLQDARHMCRVAAQIAPSYFQKVERKITYARPDADAFEVISEVLHTSLNALEVAQSNYASLTSEYNALRSVVEGLQREVNQKTDEIDELKANAQDLDIKLTRLQRINDAAHHDIDDLTKKNEDMQRALLERNSRIDSLEENVRQGTRDLETVKNNLEQIKGQLAVVQGEAERERVARTNTEEDNRRLSQQVHSLEQSLREEQEALPTEVVSGPLAERIKQGQLVAPSEVRFIYGVFRAIKAAQQVDISEIHVPSLIYSLGQQLMLMFDKMGIDAKQKRDAADEFASYVNELISGVAELRIFVPYIGDRVDGATMDREAGRSEVVQDIRNWGIRKKGGIERRALVA